MDPSIILDSLFTTIASLLSVLDLMDVWLHIYHLKHVKKGLFERHRKMVTNPGSCILLNRCTTFEEEIPSFVLHYCSGVDIEVSPLRSMPTIHVSHIHTVLFVFAKQITLPGFYFPNTNIVFLP